MIKTPGKADFPDLALIKARPGEEPSAQPLIQTPEEADFPDPALIKARPGDNQVPSDDGLDEASVGRGALDHVALVHRTMAMAAASQPADAR